MALKALGPVTRLLEGLLAAEPRLREGENLPPCAMVVGPPRSGTTVLYQVLAGLLPCAYISNLHVLFPRSASRWLGEGPGPGGPLRSFYGHSRGLRGVNEGNEFFRKVGLADPGPQAVKADLGRIAALAGAGPGRPLLFKNVESMGNLALWHEAAPGMVFVVARRHPEALVESIYRAYLELGTFNPYPEELGPGPPEDPIEASARVARILTDRIERQRGGIAPDRWLDVPYESFCSDPRPWASALAGSLELDPGRLRGTGDRSALQVPPSRVSEGERARIREALGRFFPGKPL
jgi:hypothetical protein